MSTDKYQQLGASAKKTGVHKALAQAGLASNHSYFASFSDDIAGDPTYRSFLHADGAGTKCIVAYLMAQETGDLKWFRGLAQDALVMNLDDIFCIGRPERLQISNTIGRNARLITDEALSEIMSSYAELTEMLKSYDINIDLMGGETADCGDTVRTLVVDAVMAGRIKAENLISTDNVRPGDIIVGLANTGRTVYEKSDNSSIASNGLTLARHCMLAKENAARYPEIIDPGLSSDVAYVGPFKATDTPAELAGMSVGEALASPTRTFAPLLARIYSVLGQEVHGVIHNTGGGQTKNLRFGRGNHYIKNDLFPVPPLFSLIQKYGEVSSSEMYRVFNMGHRIELFLEERHFALIDTMAKELGISAKIIGHVEKNSGSETDNQVTISSGLGTFNYLL
ncbi:MAG: AIR synthase-related protein [bacterium]|nr:AIR synthase-related protein [bacterium]